MRTPKPLTNKEYRVIALHKKLKCALCPPNKGENASRKPKHGAKKPKYKNKRK